MDRRRHYDFFMDFFGSLIEKIESVGFSPLAPLEKSKSTYTLHNVVRDQLGMVERKEVSALTRTGKNSDLKEAEVHILSDMSDVAYWDYKELRVFLTSVHNMMNEEVSAFVGKPTNAVAWSHNPSRIQSEIIDLFNRLRLKNPHLQVPELAQKRLSAKKMVQKGRPVAAIANTLAVLAANGSSYGDLFGQCSELNLSNESLLDHLDAQVEKSKANREVIDSESLVPRNLVRAYVKNGADMAKLDLGRPTICQFLKSMNDSNNFVENSVEAILVRLSAYIDEKAETDAD